MELNECAELLRSKDNILIVTHIRPDGDAHGSAAALCRSLRSMGKTAWVYDNPETTENYVTDMAPYVAPEGFAPDFTVTVDTADVGVFPVGFEGHVDLAIDHHGSNSGYADGTICWPKKASCGELVMELVKLLAGGIDRESADLLYMAVSTDTGCFVYANTTAETHRAAAELMDAGADYRRLNVKHFRTVSPGRLKLEGMIYSGLRRERGGLVNIVTVTLDMMERAGAIENDCEDLASLSGKIAGNRVGVTIRELAPGRCKISVRTHEDVDASAICARFGGGGHAMAAGCTIEDTPHGAAERLLAAIDEVMP